MVEKPARRELPPILVNKAWTITVCPYCRSQVHVDKNGWECWCCEYPEDDAVEITVVEAAQELPPQPHHEGESE